MNAQKASTEGLDRVSKVSEHAGSRSYYKDVVPGLEYMDIMEHVLGPQGTVEHLRGQIFKYLFRLGKKDDAASESEKIAWYSARLDDVVKRIKNGGFPIMRKQPVDIMQVIPANEYPDRANRKRR